MHILIIPSEQYIPKETPMEGIFQKDQALLLKSKGNKVGVISIRLKYSIYMLFKTLLFKLIRITLNNELDNKGIKFILKTLFIKVFNLRRYVHKEILNDIPVFRCESYNGLYLNTKNEYKGWIKGGLVAFNEYIKNYGKPDIIHAHNMKNAGLLASKLKKKYKIPVVVTEHSSYYARNLFSNFTLKKINNSLKNIDEFCVVSQSLGSLLIKKLSNLNRFSILPNLLDLDFKNRSLNTKNVGNDFTFINVASFIEIKGQVNLIKSFALKFKGNDKIRLKLIGGGELKNDLIKISIKENIENQVEIIDELTRIEILNELDLSDVFVFSSIYETFGVSVIEALSRGLPIVSTKCGGPESIINKTNGILVDNNISALSEGMEKMKNNVSLFEKEKIRKDSVKEYGYEAIYRKLNNTYTNILEK